MRWIVAFIFVHCFSTGLAQSPGNIKFTTYTRANGLPEENITSILQDSRGFIWIGSQEGLFRFDGLHFKSWYANPNDVTRFKSNNIKVIAEYKPGTLLFSSNYDLWQLDLATQRPEPFTNFTNKPVSSIKKISANRWCVARADSLFVTDNNLSIIYSLSLAAYFPAGGVACFPLTANYTLLYSLNPHVYYLLDHEKKQLIALHIDNSGLDSRAKFFTPQVFDSTRRRLYLSAYFDGYFYCDLDIPAMKNYKPLRMSAQEDGAIRVTMLLPGGKLLQGGDNGLYIVDTGNNGNFRAKKILSKTILDAYRDKDGDFWLSTTTGITRFSLSSPVVNAWQPATSFEKVGEFKSILKGNDGKFYFLTQNGSLTEFNTTTGTSTGLDKGLVYCWSAVKNNDEIIATGGGRRILIYNTTTKKIAYPGFLQPFYTKNTDVVTLVFRARNGDLWYSCNGNVGIIKNPSGSDQYIQYSNSLSPPSFSHSYVHCATEDDEGNIWFGGNRTDMILKWDTKKQHFEEHAVSEFLPGHTLRFGINNLYVDATDHLWIALDGAGLVKYDFKNNTGQYYDINKGLPTDAVNGMTSDSKKRVWLATRKGLCCYLPEKDNIVTFTIYDGLPEDNFEGFAIFYDKEKNILYVGAKRSIAYFDPDALLGRAMASQSPVFIDEMLVNGKPFYFENEKNISLKTKENNIEFNFAVPDLNRNNQLIFQYLLKGAGSQWIDLGDKRSVTFNNLQHGHYSLYVRSKYKGNETWKETDHPFFFSIRTPLLKTVWFRLLMIAITGLLVWFIIRSYYRQKLQRQRSVLEKQQAIEKERTRIATDMHDDFGASLSRIKFLSEKLQLYKTGDSAESTDLQKISLYSDEMSEKMNEIVWALNQRYDSMEDLVSFSRSYASEYLQDKNIKLHFTTSGISEQQIQGETRRNIFLVIKEALHNIVKHAGATEVSISFSHDKDLQVMIADNGKGFDADNIHQFANGLENMKKRIMDIQGRILIENKKGTQITISAPV